MTKAKKPADKATDAEYICVVDRINFDDGRLLMRDQTIILSDEEASTYLAGEMLERV